MLEKLLLAFCLIVYSQPLSPPVKPGSINTYFTQEHQGVKKTPTDSRAKVQDTMIKGKQKFNFCSAATELQ